MSENVLLVSVLTIQVYVGISFATASFYFSFIASRLDPVPEQNFGSTSLWCLLCFRFVEKDVSL